MNSMSHTIPAFPHPRLSVPARPGYPGLSNAVAAALPRLAGGLRRILSGEHDTASLEKRLVRSARRGKPIALGTVDEPYEPAPGQRLPLAGLRRFAGLAVRVVTRSSWMVDGLDLLADLDQQHAVVVDVPFAGIDPCSPAGRTSLGVVRAMAERGLTVRVVLPRLAGRDHRTADADRLRCLVAAGVACGASDLLLRRADRRGRGPWLRDARRLRLEYALPRPLPGRG